MARTRQFNSPTDFIQAQTKEATKEHIVYDGTDRMIESYVTFWNAQDAEPALKTTYIYDGSSGRVVGRKETLSTWDGSWDF